MRGPDTVASGSPHAVHARAAGASLIQVESSKLVPLIVVLSILCGMAIAFSAFAFYQTTLAEREARMLQYYVLEMDAKLIAAGVKKADESTAAKLKEK